MVRGYAAKADHALETVGQCWANPLALRHQGKDITGALRCAEAFARNQVLAHLQCGLVGTLDVESGGILAGEVGGEGGAYSSCALVAQRSMVAALLIRTSANIDFPLFLNVAQQSGSGAIERVFFAKNGGLKQDGLNVFCSTSVRL